MGKYRACSKTLCNIGPLAGLSLRKNSKAYIPLDPKPFALGPGVGFDPQRHNFAMGIPTCWYLKTLKFALFPTRNIKFVLPPAQNPNASQWNIGCVGSQTHNFRVGHVHFIFWCGDFIRIGSRFSVEYGLLTHVVV